MQERHSLAPDASVFDTSAQQREIIETEKRLQELDKKEKKGLYDDDLSIPDRVGNTLKEWGNKALYSTDYITQTAGTALEDFVEKQTNEEYKNLLNRQWDLSVQINRIDAGLDEDPYGKKRVALINQLNQLNRYIDDNYRVKMDTTTDAYRAMDRAQQYEDKAVEGLNWWGKAGYNIVSNLAEVALLNQIGKVYSGLPLAIDAINESAGKMHEINSAGGTTGQAVGQGVTAAGILLAAEKMPVKDIVSLANSDVGQMVLSEEFAKHGLKISKNIFEYAANYSANLAYQNPNAELSLIELAEEIVKDYTESMFFDY